MAYKRIAVTNKTRKKGMKKEMFKLLRQRNKLEAESNKSGNNCLLPELMIYPTFKN